MSIVRSRMCIRDKVVKRECSRRSCTDLDPAHQSASSVDLPVFFELFFRHFKSHGHGIFRSLMERLERQALRAR